IITYRPEFEPPWIGRPYVTALTLNRLGEHEIAAMVVRVAGNKPLPETVRRDIIERTDGIPLFVEEMTKAVLEAAAEGVAEHTIAAVPRSSIEIAFRSGRRDERLSCWSSGLPWGVLSQYGIEDDKEL